MELRQLSTDDAADYQDLRLYALQESPTAFGASYEEEVDRPLQVIEERLTDEQNHIFGAFAKDGQLQGVVTLRRNRHRKGAHRANIYAMYVAPTYRGQGVGRALLKKAIARAADLGLSWINLMVNNGNEAAVGLYESCGFETFGLEKDAFRVGNDSYDAAYMTRRLA